MSVEVYVQEILARHGLDTISEQSAQAVDSTVDRIRELQKGNKLAGLQIKELIHGF